MPRVAYPGRSWALAFILLFATDAAAGDRPNVLILLADDLGWNDVGYHGSAIRTPHIDALAQEGVELDRFYAFPTCSPTRVALMTGRSPITLGFDKPLLTDAHGLDAEEVTLPQLFRDAGYRTALVGKWHLGAVRALDHPNRRGFDHFYGFLHGGLDYYTRLVLGGVDWQRNGSTVREEGYTTDLLADEAVRLIRERGDAPFFLYVSFNAPHVPNQAPQEAIDAAPEFHDPLRRVHAAMVERMDEGIGRILAALEEEGIARDTLVWFASDNGGAIPDVFRSWVGWVMPPMTAVASNNRPLRGGKMTPFEGGVRVPAVVRWPRVLTPRRSLQRVTVQDVLPTLVDVLGLSDPRAAIRDGASRWGAVTGDSQAPALDFLVGNAGSFAYYRGPWKLVQATSPVPFGMHDTGTFLFRIDEDPGEQRDLAAARPEIAAALIEAIAAHPKGERDLGVPSPGEIGALFDPDPKETQPPWAERMSAQ